jgi:hypothetical protein
MIRDTEEYYKSDEFEFTGNTGWYEFIAGQWSRILAEREPEDLDLRYSAHQCALNLLRCGQRADAEHDDEEARVAEAVAN